MSKCVIAIDHDDLVAAINALKMVCFEGVSLENAYLCREKDPDLNDAYESLLNVMDIFEDVERVADLDCDSSKFTPRVSQQIAEQIAAQIYNAKADQAVQAKKKPLTSTKSNTYTMYDTTDMLRNLSDEDIEKLYDAISNTDLGDDEDCQCEECLSEHEQSCLDCGEPMSNHVNNEISLGQLLKNAIVELAGEMLGQVNGILLAYGRTPLKEIRFTRDDNGIYVVRIRR